MANTLVFIRVNSWLTWKNKACPEHSRMGQFISYWVLRDAYCEKLFEKTKPIWRKINVIHWKKRDYDNTSVFIRVNSCLTSRNKANFEQNKENQGLRVITADERTHDRTRCASLVHVRGTPAFGEWKSIDRTFKKPLYSRHLRSKRS
jgi:hypothetical protein